jgi:tetratricopeptide (TPR) repeat protein
MFHSFRLFKPMLTAVTLCCLMGIVSASQAQDAVGDAARIADNPADNPREVLERKINALTHEAEALELEGKWEEARSVYRQILPLADDNIRNFHVAEIAIGSTYLREENYPAALREYQNITKHKNYDVVHMSLAEIHIAGAYMHMEEYATAREHLAIVLGIKEEQAPRDADIIISDREDAAMMMGRSFFEEKDYVNARTAYRQVLSMKGLPTHHKEEAERQLAKIDGLIGKE